jgi:O-antigen ligase
MFKAPWLQNALNYALCIIALAIPFPYIYSSLAIVLFAVLWVVQINFRTLGQNFRERKVLWLWVLFFLMHAASYFYSSDKHESLFDLQKKASLIVLPILIGAGMPIDKKKLKQIFVCFNIGVTVVAVFCIVRAYLIYHYTGLTTQFFYHPLVKGFSANAVYMGLYTLFSIAILLFFDWKNNFYKYIRFILVAIQLVFFIFLSSRTLILFLFVVVLPAYFIDAFFIKKSDFFLKLIICVSAIAVGVILFKTDNPIRQRYADVLTSREKITWNDYKTNKKMEFNNLSLRLFFWRVCIDNMKEHDLWWKGAGNGGVYELQNKKMSEYGIEDIYNEKERSVLFNVNLHNMYLQSLMMLGVGGLLVFVLLILSPLAYVRRFDNKMVLFIFGFVMAVLMMQESSLQTQAGVVFYTLFSMIFCNYAYTRRREQLSISA